MPKRVDRNHGEIVQALRKAGVLVQSLATIGKGCPDLLCQVAGRTTLLEIKTAKGKVTEDQLNFLKAGWRFAVVRDAESAIAAVHEN